MAEYAPVVGEIDVCADGELRWHSDGTPIPKCTGCGSSLYERWRAPDTVWRRLRGASKHLCWSCFVLVMTGATFQSEDGE